MQVAENCVVAFHYSLWNQEGNELDTSRGGLPTLYLHGHGQLIPGLERALSGRLPGETLEMVIPPADAYGMRDPELVQKMPRALIEHVGEIQPGMEFQAQTETGTLAVRVIDVDDQFVTVDGNHPWAGLDLRVALEIRHVRRATREEIEEGMADPD
jgi:FKBP-type peptidyl-prolyl cis-trans isomerase SlyD